MTGLVLREAGLSAMMLAILTCFVVSTTLGWRMKWFGVIVACVFNLSCSACMFILGWIAGWPWFSARDALVVLAAVLLLTVPAVAMAKVRSDSDRGIA
ncbi:MAG TPA: hypothetical protein P5572_12045 [Phycisphaerae bacterium]|nr:hypothetical protein [Phycisphaerae bacterium]